MSPVIGKSSRTYEEIKAQCLADGTLFEDPDFPEFGSTDFGVSDCDHVWLKPWEFLEDSDLEPEFFVGETNRFDVIQGDLGDCWFQAAVAIICEHKELLEKVVPPGQGFEKGSYAGIFHFNFWWYGEWTEVIIDDRLPVCGDDLASLKSSQRNEFWRALLEKAYAKLRGGYMTLDGGFSIHAFEDFTGGLCESFSLPLTSLKPSELWQILLKADERGSLMSASTDQPDGECENEAPLDSGLVTGHAYSVTKVKEMTLSTVGQEKIPLMRLRNPHGDGSEWRKSWGDSSVEWNSVSKEEKQAIGLVKEADGEFWMSYEDFLINFIELQVCYLGPESISENDPSTRKVSWNVAQHKGSWIKGVSAGGCGNDPYTDALYSNPQFKFEIVEASCDEGDTVIIALMQKERQTLKESEYSIGIYLYKLDSAQRDERLKKDFFCRQGTVYESDFCCNDRQLVARLKLPVGLYCVLPTTLDYNEEADFLLRIYTEQSIVTEQLDEKTGLKQSQITKEELKDKLDIKISTKHSLPTNEVTKEKAREAYKLLAGDQKKVDAYELKAILDFLFVHEFKFDGFDVETCKSILASKDTDLSGELEIEEFVDLIEDIVVWGMLFKLHEDKDGCIGNYLLRDLLEEIGISLSNKTFQALIRRYSHRSGKIYFDDFIHVATRLTTVLGTFEKLKDRPTDKQDTDILDQFIRITIYS